MQVSEREGIALLYYQLPNIIILCVQVRQFYTRVEVNVLHLSEEDPKYDSS